MSSSNPSGPPRNIIHFSNISLADGAPDPPKPPPVTTQKETAHVDAPPAPVESTTPTPDSADVPPDPSVISANTVSDTAGSSPTESVGLSPYVVTSCLVRAWGITLAVSIVSTCLVVRASNAFPDLTSRQFFAKFFRGCDR